MTKSGNEPRPRLVLDSSAYSHLRAGNAVVLDRIAAAELALVPVIVLGELEAGFEIGGRRKENRVTLMEFLAEPFVSLLPVTPQVARRYAQVYAHLRAAGTPIPTNDIWIAATTLDCGGHLLTFDRHFDRIPFLPRTVL